MENLKKYTKLKAELLHKKEQALLTSAGKLQVSLLEVIVAEFISKLDVENGYVKNTQANKKRIAALNRIFEKFNNGDFAKVASSMISDMKDIHNLNTDWFSQINAKKVKDIQGRVFDRLKGNFGIEGNKLVPGGFLDSFIKDPSLLNQVKQTTLRAITSDNITMRDYRESIKRIIVGDDKVQGGFERHFKTFATDTYALFDRTTNFEFATTLGLKYAVYAGGLIETSRPFCEIRNNKVFTSDEIRKFGTSKDTYGGYIDKKDGEFQGKPKDVYDPFTMCGGYNCRHTLNYISEALAKKMRPDLK
jgi:hypothetical protein